MSSLPTTYVRYQRYGDWEIANPAIPKRGVDLDGDFDRVKTSLDQTQNRLREIQRDDGPLKNRIVTLDSLSNQVRSLLVFTTGNNIRGAWLTATAYAVKDVVTQGGNTYITGTAHTSGVFATDLAAGKWVALDASGTIRAELAATGPTEGDNMIGVLRTDTGASARTQHDKNRDILNVADFGASPAASLATNTAAFLAAYNAASDSQKIYVNPGDYAVTAPVWNVKNVVWICDGSTLAGSGGSTIPLPGLVVTQLGSTSYAEQKTNTTGDDNVYYVYRDTSTPGGGGSTCFFSQTDIRAAANTATESGSKHIVTNYCDDATAYGFQGIAIRSSRTKGQIVGGYNFVQEVGGLADSVNKMVGSESILLAAGADSNVQRFGNLVWIGTSGGGAQCVASYGYCLRPFSDDPAQGKVTLGYGFFGIEFDVAFDASSGDGPVALKMNADQEIEFNAGGTSRKAYYDATATALIYMVDGVEVLRVTDAGNITHSGDLSVGDDAAIAGDATIGGGLDVTGEVTGATFELTEGGPFWSKGAGSPEGVVTAPIGSLYSNTSGGASTTLYVKESGAGNTGWTAK